MCIAHRAPSTDRVDSTGDARRGPASKEWYGQGAVMGKIPTPTIILPLSASRTELREADQRTEHDRRLLERLRHHQQPVTLIRETGVSLGRRCL